MGNSLHNKIYLGRRIRGFHSRHMQALLCAAALAGVGILWLVIRTLK